MRFVSEKEQKGQKEAQEVSSVGMHLVTWASAGLEISPDTHKPCLKSGPHPGPSARLRGLLYVSLISPKRQGLSGGVCVGGSRHGSTGPRKQGTVGQAGLGYTVSAKPLLHEL